MIRIEIHAMPTEDQRDDLLEEVMALIADGFTSGYHPYWTYEEIDQADEGED